MESWPDKLPTLRADGFRQAQVDPLVRTDMDAGNQRARRRFTNTDELLQAMADFTWREQAAFEYWRANKIAGGADWFFIDLPFAGDVQTVEAKLEAVTELERQPGENVVLQFSLRVRDVPMWSEAQYNDWLANG